MKLALSGPKPPITSPMLANGADDPANLLVEQGVFQPEGRARWQMGQLCLTSDRLRFMQPRGAQFDIPLDWIVDVAMEQKSFVAVHKPAMAVTFQHPNRRVPGKVWFITPLVGQWLARLSPPTAGPTRRAAVGREHDAPVRHKPHAEKSAHRQLPHLTTSQVERLAHRLEPASQEILWHLRLHRHATIQELANLVAARTHMEVLFRIRQEINPAAEQVLGYPILVFAESKLDAETGTVVAFCWWFAGAAPPIRVRPPAAAELFEETDKINIVVELLGVDEQAICVSAQGDKVVIWTEDAALSFYEEIALPVAVAAGTMKTHYVNNILSIDLRKLEGKAP